MATDTPLTSSFHGVYFFRDTNRWAAQILPTLNKVQLGLFSTEEAAARAWDAEARKHRKYDA